MRRQRRAGTFGQAHGVALVALLATLATACGMRVPGEQLNSRELRGAGAVQATPERTVAPPRTDDRLATGPEDGPTTAEPAGGASDIERTSDADPGPLPDTTADTPRPSEDATVRAKREPATGGGDLAPIVVGMDGTWSGMQGATVRPMKTAYQAWARMINDRGGIAGHPVELIVTDNGGSASQSMANVRDMIENRGAIAIVNYTGDIQAVADYAEEKNFPVIGGLGLEEPWHDSPNMFAARTGPDNGDWALAKLAIEEGANKVAFVYCSEVPSCRDRQQVAAKFFEELGADVVYEAGVSIGQPDYTAECVAARNAGADTFVPYVDGNSINRIAESCDRQAYNPLWVTAGPSPNVVPETEGMLGTFRWFPWFLTSGNPGIEEYHQALTRYAPEQKRGYFGASGWTSGKLLEKAASNVSLSNPPTSQDLFEGLWKMKDETLGDIVMPFTFIREQPAPPANCVYMGRVRDAEWALPRGLELTGCRPGY